MVGWLIRWTRYLEHNDADDLAQDICENSDNFCSLKKFRTKNLFNHMNDANATVREAQADAIPRVLSNIHTNARTSNDAEKGKFSIFWRRRLDLRLSLNSHCTADVKWDYAKTRANTRAHRVFRRPISINLTRGLVFYNFFRPSNHQTVDKVN